MGRIDGRVALVTGAARGQGRAHCVRLAQEGAKVIALDICSAIETSGSVPATSEDLEETVGLVHRNGGEIFARQVDVRFLEQMQRAVAEGVASYGDRLDVVVANAGIVSYGMSWELTFEQWKSMLDVNLTGVWTTTTAAVPHMLAAGHGGSIILTSSTCGYRGYVGLSHYGAAKHGVVGLCRALAVELGPHNIRVNSIHPNGVNTLLGEPGPGEERVFDRITDEHPLGRLVMQAALPQRNQDPEDVAAMVSWLASDESRFITGHQFPISSGNQLI